MKKFLFLAFIFSAVISLNLHAQNGPKAADMPQQAAMIQQAKEKQVPMLVEKAGLTEAQANRVVEINIEIRMAAGDMRDLSDADRATKIAALKADKEKRYSEIPLTPEQIQTVYKAYQDMGKDMQKKAAN